MLALAGSMFALHIGRRSTAFRAGCSALSALFLVGIFPLGDLLLQPIERSFPANPPLSRVDGIIVLGGAEDVSGTAYWQQVQLNGSAERVTTATALARRFPNARVLFAGGSGRLRDVNGAGVSESHVAQAFFRAQGIEAPRLLLEGGSRNTVENARFSLPIAKPQPGEVWVLVTTAYHMPRAMRTFANAGWPALVPYPVDYRTAAFADGIRWDLSGHLDVLNIAVRETVGQLAYRLLGR